MKKDKNIISDNISIAKNAILIAKLTSK